MSHDRILLAGVACLISLAGPLLWCPEAFAQNPIPLEDGIAQLFVDDYLIDSQRDLRRTLHQPGKDDGGKKPILSLDREFEGLGATLEANGTIVYDPAIKKYVMFALGYSGDWGRNRRKWDSVRLYRFTSADGLNRALNGSQRVRHREEPGCSRAPVLVGGRRSSSPRACREG